MSEDKHLKIQLYNRYREKVYIEHIKENEYLLYTDTTDEFDYTRYGYNSWPDDIEFVDPAGGPFVSKGENTLSIVNDSEHSSVKLTVDKIIPRFDENDVTRGAYLTISSIELI